MDVEPYPNRRVPLDNLDVIELGERDVATATTSK